jgi:ribonuclease P protein component
VGGKPLFRLKKPGDFQICYRQGKSSRGRLTTIYCRPNGLTYNRVGFSTGKRLGGAVVRNRIKRRLREIMRLAEADKRLKTGYDIILAPKPSAVDVGYQELRGSVYAGLKKLGLVYDRTVNNNDEDKSEKHDDVQAFGDGIN